MSSNASEAAPCGDRAALNKRATPGAATGPRKLDAPALMDAHFVSIVRGYEELYMCDHPQYGDWERRCDVWDEIGTIMNQPAGYCKKRWSRIRENYLRNEKRARGRSKDTVYPSKRPAHEKLLSFLTPTFETTNKDLRDNLATTVLDSDQETPESEKDSSDADNNLSEKEHSTDDSDSSSTDDVQGHTTQTEDAAPAPGQQSPLEHDDVVDFFVELGESVKDFPEGVRIQVKREAFKIVTDAEEMLYHQKIKADLEMNTSENHD